MIVLDHAGDRDGEPEIVQDREADVHLSPAAVHEDQVRELRKGAELLVKSLLLPLLLLLQPVPEAPCQDFLHAGVVIRPGDALNPELTVVGSLRLSLLVDHHGADIRKARDVRDIVAFHALDPRKVQDSLELLHRADRAALLALQSLLVLGEDQSRVLLCKLDELFLLPLHRDDDGDLALSPDAKVLLQKLPVLDVLREHDGLRDKRGSRVELVHELRQDLRRRLPADVVHIEVLPSDESAVADEEHLHPRVRIGVLLVLCDADDVLVLTGALGHLLALGDLLYGI